MFLESFSMVCGCELLHVGFRFCLIMCWGEVLGYFLILLRLGCFQVAFTKQPQTTFPQCNYINRMSILQIPKHVGEFIKALSNLQSASRKTLEIVRIIRTTS